MTENYSREKRGRDWGRSRPPAPHTSESFEDDRQKMDCRNSKYDKDESRAKNSRRDYDKCNRKSSGRKDRSSAYRNDRGCDRRERKSKRQCSPNFHQILKTVKGRMDSTFRSLEKGLKQVEKNMNEELANVLAQVMDFEEDMKPQLLKPYKKCKEFESLITPALSHMPKRSASENCGSRRKHSCGRDFQVQPKMSAKDRYRDLMSSWCDKEKSKDAQASGSRDRCDPSERRGRSDSQDVARGKYGPCDGDAEHQDYSGDESIDDEVGKTMQELQDISISVNNSLKRINRAFNHTQECEERSVPIAPITNNRPEMLDRVNDSLAQIGTGAKLLKRLLVEERTKANC